jgi:hypothetical protein
MGVNVWPPGSAEAGKGHYSVICDRQSRRTQLRLRRERHHFLVRGVSSAFCAAGTTADRRSIPAHR